MIFVSDMLDHADAYHAIELPRDFAVIAQLDLVISNDTAVAHLAGAMGKPVWILLPFVADFRWLLDRDDSPWYPSARLFRKSKSRDWNEVVMHVAGALAAADLQRKR